jgi:integrase
MKIPKTSEKYRQIPTAGSKLVAKSDFTKRRVDLMVCPSTAKRAYFYDARVRGLALAVTPLGKKGFILYRKVDGRPERITIGPYPDLSIDQARRKAEELNGKIAQGENPAEKRRAIRDENTLAELFASYSENAKRKRNLGEHGRRFRVHLTKWRFKKISSIRHGDVLLLHERIKNKRAVIPASAPGAPVRKAQMIGGPYAANRVVELLSAMFNHARETGWKGENPAEDIEAFPERKRRRFLKSEELPAFFKSLDQETNEVIRDYVLLSLLSGARRSNVQSMRWDEIAWTEATWTIPAAKAKEDEDINVALSPVAMRLLEKRKDVSTSEWVFPGRGRSGHLVEPKTTWKRIVSRAGLADLRLHDLRRTLGSWQAATGASMPIIGKSLGHADGSSATKVYARLEMDPVRVSVNRAGAALLTAGGLAGLLAEGKE